jgi:hypothetical protein
MIVEHTKNRKFRRWTCGSCDKLLGLIYLNGTVALKYKDFVAWVSGDIRTICRGCQTENTYRHEKNLEDLLDSNL